MFRMVAAVRGQRRRRGLEEVKLMFVVVKKAHLYARCEEEEWFSCHKSSGSMASTRGCGDGFMA